ncbi:MAG: hypothetical protein GY861_25470 [bacterium]|nr:hypothetical protein [bacterium]
MLKDLQDAKYRSGFDSVKDHFFDNKKTSAERKEKGIDCKFLNYCNKNGKCVNGKCVCSPGWMNYDCSISKKSPINFRYLP